MKEISAPAPEQKEKAKHGEQMFPLQQYITELSDSYPAVTAHWHEEAEFTLIEEGSCVYQAHLQSYPVQPGDLIFLPPMTLHAISSIPGTGMRSETYVFHMNFLGINSADVCAVTDTAQNTTGMICLFDHFLIMHCKSIIVFRAFRGGNSKAVADLHGFNGTDGHNGFGKIGIQLIKDRVTDTCRHTGYYALNNTAAGIFLLV